MTKDLLEALGASPEAEEKEERIAAAPSEPRDDGSSPCPCEERSDAAIRSPADGEETDRRTGAAAPVRDDRSLRAHFAALCAQGEELRREFPDFDLSAALHDPDFLRLTAPGMGVEPRRAWLALHPELLERRAAEASAAALARSLSSGAMRPREGGGQSGAALSADYRGLPAAERRRLRQRIYDAAALGEKIYP